MEKSRTFGRYKSFRAWMLDTLMLNLILLIGLTWLMGCYDSIGYRIGMEVSHLFGITAI